MHTSKSAVLRLLSGAVMISFSPVFVRIATVPPTVSAFYRMVIGGLILAAITLMRGQKLRCSRPAAVALCAAGVLISLDLWVWHRSILYIGPGLATLLGNLQVFVLAVAGVLFLGERLSGTTIVAILIAVSGLALIVGVDFGVFDSQYRLGLIFGLATAVLYGAYILALRRARVVEPESSAGRDLTIVSLFAAVILGVACVAENVPMGLSLQDAGILSGYALCTQVLGWVVISGALSQVPPSLVGLVLLLQPALAFVWDIAFFGRSISAREAIGAALVLAAIYARSRVDSRPRR